MLVSCRSGADPHERPHRRRVVQDLFDGGVRQIEPVLEEVHPQHALQADGRPAVPRLRVHRFDARAEVAPGHHTIHLGEELRPSRHLRVLLEAGTGQTNSEIP
jgi:hypothetical protein